MPRLCDSWSTRLIPDAITARATPSTVRNPVHGAVERTATGIHGASTAVTLAAGGVRAIACGAKTRKGTRCPNPAMANGKCRMHGGATPVGPASPHWITGARSKLFEALPGKLAEAYQAAYEDPQLLWLRKELSLVDALNVDLVKQLDTGESGAAWKRLAGLWQQFLRAQAEPDGALDQVAIQGEISAVLAGGVGEAALREELARLMDLRRKLMEAELKRLQALHQVLTAEQTRAIVDRLAGSLREHVADRDAIANVVADIRPLLGGGQTVSGEQR